MEPPNYYVLNAAAGEHRPITHRVSLASERPELRPQLVHYRRSDGVELSGELYLPGGRLPAKPLPTLIWAYPHRYLGREAAGEVMGSANRYMLDQGPLMEEGLRLLVTQGYAVLWNAGMPLVDIGSADYPIVSQLVGNAQAAVDKLVDMRVADRNRIAIGGHSFGATMVGILLANSDLFAAGVAVDGGFNAFNDPFGTSQVPRTLWQAPADYFQLSSVLKADQIHAPFLLLHGAEDQIPGTSVAESQLMFQALNGLGRQARLVILPYEDHVTEARESVEHSLWEVDSWLDRYLKSEPNRNFASK
jgi:dipeptidyl aminopeptidase/acylaminoacyl peptidase